MDTKRIPKSVVRITRIEHESGSESTVVYRRKRRRKKRKLLLERLSKEIRRDLEDGERLVRRVATRKRRALKRKHIRWVGDIGFDAAKAARKAL